MRATHTITGSSSLQRVLWLRRGTRIALALPTFTVVQQENLEQRFNRQLSDSGYEFCILALIAALVGCILFDAARWSIFTAHAAELLTMNLLVCLGAAVLGRVLGFLRARWQLARLIWAVAELLEESDDLRFSRTFTPRGESFAMHKRSASGITRPSF